ncbi:MAG: hypothetical protein QG670_32, partial [Thermoproteota archaeon]|nr:hypothetical protein [Thermoproteota archaeon]
INGEVPMISNLSEDIFNYIKNRDCVKVSSFNKEAFVELIE